MRVLVLALVIIGSFIGLASAQIGLGDRLSRGYTTYDTLPITTSQAQSLGWSPVNNTCIPSLGQPWSLNGAKGATKSKPMILYFTLAGQVAGISMNVYGEPKSPPGYWRRIDGGVYFMSVSFRNSSSVCSTSKFVEPVGNQLVINQATTSIVVPTTISSGVTGNWTKGSCFDSMGDHYFWDVSTRSPRMSWIAANMIPFVPMYYQGKINAFFFASTDVQQQLLPLPSTNMWDLIALPNILMCKNWCDSACTFADTNFWSTLHIYFADEKKITCGGGCTRACCPGMTHNNPEDDKLLDMMHMMPVP